MENASDTPRSSARIGPAIRHARETILIVDDALTALATAESASCTSCSRPFSSSCWAGSMETLLFVFACSNIWLKSSSDGAAS